MNELSQIPDTFQRDIRQPVKFGKAVRHSQLGWCKTNSRELECIHQLRPDEKIAHRVTNGCGTYSHVNNMSKC